MSEGDRDRLLALWQARWGGRTLNSVLTELGYTTEPATSKHSAKHIIGPDGTDHGDMRADECWRFLTTRHGTAS